MTDRREFLLGAGGLVATAALPACADDATVFPSRGRYERLSLAPPQIAAEYAMLFPAG